ncbi:NAD(P)-dependent oxidoreductase [Ruegeria sp. HKCCA5763]|uniref:NAD-dependent epimerase/dehydratase family protein n=1 Tax=Ruegeria sp. HKCCA5763 TaxID=2682987 RepID=UPI001489E338|nr:NAD(P)-dependent oxidoreductase [Ruegeria sp. HKCCA5763]
MARVLLTGATGLIGKAAISALAASGCEVIALSRRGPVDAAHQTLPCDLLNAQEVSAAVRQARASHLLHLAWHDGPKDRWVSPANLDWMAASLHLVRAFAEAGGERAVCAGSCAEYDWSIPELTEASPLRPCTLYGAAKAGTGMALCAAQDTLGLSLVWARIFFVFGPGEPPGRLLGDLITNLKAGNPADCTDGVQQRDFLHVDDLARALSVLLNSDVSGPVNVASGAAIAVRDLISEVAAQLDRSDLIRLGAITRHPDDPARLAADVTRLRQEAGFTPRYDLQSAVAAVLASEGLA